jgi:hypothetical protein
MTTHRGLKTLLLHLVFILLHPDQKLQLTIAFDQNRAQGLLWIKLGCGQSFYKYRKSGKNSRFSLLST